MVDQKHQFWDAVQQMKKHERLQDQQWSSPLCSQGDMLIDCPSSMLEKLHEYMQMPSPLLRLHRDIEDVHASVHAETRAASWERNRVSVHPRLKNSCGNPWTGLNPAADPPLYPRPGSSSHYKTRSVYRKGHRDERRPAIDAVR